LKGVDLRRVGSGNIGASNASRLWPGKWSVVAFCGVFLLDFGKGFLAAAWASNLSEWLGAPVDSQTVAVLCGASAVAGHVLTPYLGFRGGKGVATALGVVTALAPWSALGALGFWGLLVAITRYISLGSMAAMISIPVTYALDAGPEAFRGRFGVFLFFTGLAGIVIWRHRANIRRILQGRERRVGADDQAL
jgi:glycerol-3-phosphate acyltransferase PlsY